MKRTPRLACLLLFLGLLAATSLAQDDRGKPFPIVRPEQKPVAPPADSLAKFYHAASAAVVRINVDLPDGRRNVGSGFVLGSSGVVVTCYRLIEGSSGGSVLFSDAATRPIQGVLGYDKKQNLALLKIDPQGLTLHPLKLAAAPLEPSAEVIALGHATAFCDLISSGVVTAPLAGDDAAKADPRLKDAPVAAAGTEWLRTDAALSAGNCGGPLLLPSGEVAGVCAWSLPGEEPLGFAVPTSRIADLIASPGTVTEPVSLADVSKKESPDPAPAAFDESWMPARRVSRTVAGEAISRARKSLACSACEGTGKVTVKWVETHRGRIFTEKREKSEVRPCQQCRGSGLCWGERTAAALSVLAENLVLVNPKSGSADDLRKLDEAAREAVRQAALNDRDLAKPCNDAAATLLAEGRKSCGKPVVFFAVIYERLPLGGSSIYLARISGTTQAVLIRAAKPTGAEVNQHCLVTGLSTGPAAAPYLDTLLRFPGVQAAAIEAVH